MTWQTALWDMVNACGRWWDIVVGLIALLSALILFLKLLLNERFGAMFLARFLTGVGLLATIFIPLNSGWTKIALALLVAGCTLSILLTATGWSHRAVRLTTVFGVLGHWVYGHVVTAFVLDRTRTTRRS